jgi:hypothetical protein
MVGDQLVVGFAAGHVVWTGRLIEVLPTPR